MSGPASYATGGFTFDPGGFKTIKFFRLSEVSGTTIGLAKYQPTLDSPSAGQVKIKVVRSQHNRLTSTGIGLVANPPTSVTVRSSNNQVVASESAHVHAFAHDHPSVTSAVETAGTIGSTTLTAAIVNHTHTVDFPSATPSSGAGSSHNHTHNILYAHQHAGTYNAAGVNMATTVVLVPEVVNGADLSSITWSWWAVGQ